MLLVRFLRFMRYKSRERNEIYHSMKWFEGHFRINRCTCFKIGQWLKNGWLWTRRNRKLGVQLDNPYNRLLLQSSRDTIMDWTIVAHESFVRCLRSFTDLAEMASLQVVKLERTDRLCSNQSAQFTPIIYIYMVRLFKDLHALQYTHLYVSFNYA